MEDNRKILEGGAERQKEYKTGPKMKIKTKTSNYYIPILHFLENENANNSRLILMDPGTTSGIRCYSVSVRAKDKYSAQ